MTGPDAAPPVVVLQGGNFLNPYSLAWMLPGLRERRVYAPDTIGHPGRSAQTRLSPMDHSYGVWIADLLDGLGLDRVPLIGSSYGAGIILRAAGCLAGAHRAGGASCPQQHRCRFVVANGR